MNYRATLLGFLSNYLTEQTHTDPNLKAIQLRFQECNWKAADDHQNSASLDFLESVLIDISQGRLAKAGEAAQQQILRSDLSHEQRSAALIEQSRVAYYEGDYAGALLFIGIARTLDMDSTTKMVQHQISGACHFEMGNYSAARTELMSAKKQAELFPASNVGFYARCFEQKMISRISGIQAGREALDRLWQHFFEHHSANIDFLHFITRLEIDWARLALKPHFQWAQISVLLAQTMNDSLFLKRAEWDLALCLGHPLPHTSDALLLKLQSELQGKAESVMTSTAAACQNWLNHTKFESGHVTGPTVGTPIWVLPTAQLVIRLTPFRVWNMSKHQKALAIVEMIGMRQFSTQEIFRKVWGQKFSQRLHGSVFRGAIHRLNQLFGTDLSIDEGQVTVSPQSRFGVVK